MFSVGDTVRVLPGYGWDGAFDDGDILTVQGIVLKNYIARQSVYVSFLIDGRIMSFLPMRFTLAERPYDPTQMGDQEDDI